MTFYHNPIKTSKIPKIHQRFTRSPHLRISIAVFCVLSQRCTREWRHSQSWWPSTGRPERSARRSNPPPERSRGSRCTWTWRGRRNLVTLWRLWNPDEWVDLWLISSWFWCGKPMGFEVTNWGGGDTPKDGNWSGIYLGIWENPYPTIPWLSWFITEIQPRFPFWGLPPLHKASKPYKVSNFIRVTNSYH